MTDYTDAGFDGFLSRSVDDNPRINLDSRGPVSTQMSFDRAQVSGFMGDTLQIGKTHINNTNITVDDGSNTRVVIGDDGGF